MSERERERKREEKKIYLIENKIHLLKNIMNNKNTNDRYQKKEENFI